MTCGFRAQGLGFRVQGSGFRVQGAGYQGAALALMPNALCGVALFAFCFYTQEFLLFCFNRKVPEIKIHEIMIE